jgi:hypothetical protein
MTTFTFNAKPIPSNFKGTPQQLLDLWLERMSVAEDTSTVIVSDVQPTTNVGPWFKNGKQLWVWDGTTYIPLDVSGSILPQIFVGASEPSSTDYQIWVKITGGDTFDSLQVYVDGAWHEQDTSITPLSITTAMIADNAVTTAKIADGAVTSQKIAPNISLTKWQGGAANQFAKMASDASVPTWVDNRLTSPDLTLAFSTKVSYTHGLSAMPHLVQAYMIPQVDFVVSGTTLLYAGVPVDISSWGGAVVVKTPTEVYVRLSASPHTLAYRYARYTISSLADWKIRFQITP